MQTHGMSGRSYRDVVESSSDMTLGRHLISSRCLWTIGPELAKPEIPWPTLNSMRNVDSDCNICLGGALVGIDRTVRRFQTITPFVGGSMISVLNRSWVWITTKWKVGENPS